MDTIQLILLSVIQGLTEFLPVSSSAHLVLLSEFLGEEDQGIIFDVGVHFGTLMAALVYFKSDIRKMITNLGSYPLFSQENNLSINLVIAVIPILLTGFFLRDFVDLNLRNSLVIAWATIIFGILLYIAQIKQAKESLDTLTLKKAFIIGLFQCLALIPGTSRSGITITAGLFLGLRATEASRFSFLLAIPTIGAIALVELIRVSFIDFTENGVELSVALFISFSIAYISIDIFLRLIDKIGFTPFVIYRVLLGTWLLMYWT